MSSAVGQALESHQIEALSHEELVKYAIHITDLYKSLDARITQIETKAAVSSHCNDLLSKGLERNERHILKTAQYGKRFHLEVHKVPDKIKNNEMADKIAGVLTLTGCEVVPTTFEKCHRIRAKPDSVIVEFKTGNRNLRKWKITLYIFIIT